MNSSLLAIISGLGGAISWGAANYFATKASREKNVVLTVFNSQLILFLIMSVIALILQPNIRISIGFIVFIAINYLVFTIGLVISYRAFAAGPVSITAPIVGANSLVVVAVSVFVFNEVLRANQWIAIALLILGLFGVTYERKKKQSFSSSGVLLALVALVLIGCGIAGFVYAIDQVGWVVAVLLGYFFTAFWSGLYLLIKGQLEGPHLSKNVLGLVAFQILGTVSVSLGIEKSLAAVVIPVSSVSPLITTLMGLLLLKERVLKYKLFGAAIIIVGLVLISL